MLVDLKFKLVLAALVAVPGVFLLSTSERVQLAAAQLPLPHWAGMEPAPATLTAEQATAQLAQGQEAFARAQAALKHANYAFSTPDIPVRETVWSVADAAVEMPTLQLNPQIVHAEAIRLPASEALEKTPGDRLTLPLLDGNSLAVTVETSARLPNGDYSWRGYVDGEGDDFPVIFTVGENSAFATITSLEGSYTMESVGGVGWLYRNIVDRGEDAIIAPVDDVATYN